MKTLSYKPLPVVAALPAVTGLAGVTVRLTTDNKPYYCDGVAWSDLTAPSAAALAAKEDANKKDASGGYAGLTLFKLNLKNVAGTIVSFFTNTNTVARTYTLPNKDGTVAMLTDITGTNSGTNTGDETEATIKTKLGITTLSGSNTGDQTLAGLGGVSAVSPSTSGTFTHSGDIVLSGSGKRITGDFSNATLANRLMFQSSTVDGTTDVGAVPNGTSTTSGITAYNAADPTNASTTTLQTTSTQSKLIAGKTGTATYKPLALSVGGADVATYSEAAATLGDMRAAVNRNSPLTYSISNGNAGASAQASIVLASDEGSTLLQRNSIAGGGGFSSFTNNGYSLVGTTGAHPVHLMTNGVVRFSIDSAGVATFTGTGIGYINVPQNSQSADYTTVITDSGKHILQPSADTTARTFTIPSNASVPYPLGTAITFVNQNGAGAVTISITTDTMRLAGAGTTGSRKLAANGIATAIKLTATEWIISGTGLS